jgi:hypothetical protein
MTYEECDYCMRRICKNCEKLEECTKPKKETRLMWHPFENLKEIMEKKKKG